MTVLTKDAPPAARPSTDRVLRRFLARPEVGSLLGAVVVFGFFFAIAPPFRQVDSMATVLYQSATIGLMAVPVALLMIGGEFDLSAGVSVTTSALCAAMFNYQLNTNVWVGIVVSLVLALGIGFLNGYLVMRTKLPSFLITLATFLMLQGLNLAITKLLSGGVATNDISNMDGFAGARAVFAAQIPIGGGAQLSIAVVWWLVFVAIATWILLRTRQGNWIFAVGGKQDSARAVGVPVVRTKIGLFMAVGFTAWFSGMHLLFAFNTIQSGLGVGNELLYIAAAVIGGCLLTGGFGSAVGSAIGALIFGMTTQGIVYAGWNPDWFKFFLGATLLLATLVNIWVRIRAVRK
ncbi:ABC transporter permease [Fodinicola acaciae]|uniref:ABC transporter permease n=1 Tax=Fodinicola acaciae TaxID=2681555 RepID=UPI0013D1FE0D|nr:ABC transporter permease [Fodinicola acaciae]